MRSNCFFLFCWVSRSLPISLWYLSCLPDVARCGPVAWNAHRCGRPICRPSSSPAHLCGVSHSAWPGFGQLCNCSLGCISFTSVDIEIAKGFGFISTLISDLEIAVEPVANSNPLAPTHRAVDRSPRSERSSAAASGRFRTGRLALATSRWASVIRASTQTWARPRTRAAYGSGRSSPGVPKTRGETGKVSRHRAGHPT